MSKIIIFHFVCSLLPLFLMAQYDTQISVVTDDGLFTVSQTTTGNDMVCFPVNLWNDMVKGTKYSSENLPLFRGKIIFLEIADKKKLHCKTGVGFRCGIFDAGDEKKNFRIVVNHANRKCSVMIQLQDTNTVKIIFLDEVDWESLQKGN
jgi:hypothetical protein